MCSNRKLFCLVLRQAAAQLYDSVPPTLLLACSGAVSPPPPTLSPPHSQVLSSCLLLIQFPSPSSGHQQLKSLQWCYRAGGRWKPQCMMLFSLTGWLDPACSLPCCFPQCGTTFLPVAAKQHLHLPQPSFPPQQHSPLHRSDLSVSLSPPRLLAMKDSACLFSKEEINKNLCFLQNIHILQKGLQHRQTDRLGRGGKEAHHVSVFDVNIPSMKASGGIHLTGNMAHPPFR